MQNPQKEKGFLKKAPNKLARSSRKILLRGKKKETRKDQCTIKKSMGKTQSENKHRKGRGNFSYYKIMQVKSTKK